MLALPWSVNKKLKMDMVNVNANITTIELVIYNSKIAMHSIILVLVYCPPPNTSVLQFCNELSDVLEEMVNIRGEMIMMRVSIFASILLMTQIL